MAEIESILIEENEVNFRLDQILAKRFEGHYSRTYFQGLIEKGLVLLNGQPAKKRHKPQPGDEIEIEFTAEPGLDLKPEAIPLTILYEDADLIVVNKPAGLVVHPAPGNWSGTFVNALAYHCQNILDSNDPIRPGIVHRLDKETSGVMVAAKNQEAQRRMIENFALRKVKKCYLAIVIGNPGDRIVEGAIGRSPYNRQRMAIISSGKSAHTVVQTVQPGKKFSLVRAFPKTGRTHQIRVHLQSLGTPVLGDSLYGSIATNQKMGIKRQLLHAESLSFNHPMTLEPLLFEAGMPDDFKSVLGAL